MSESTQPENPPTEAEQTGAAKTPEELAEETGEAVFFEGTVAKIDREGRTVMSDHVMPGERTVARAATVGNLQGRTLPQDQADREERTGEQPSPDEQARDQREEKTGESEAERNSPAGQQRVAQAQQNAESAGKATKRTRK